MAQIANRGAGAPSAPGTAAPGSASSARYGGAAGVPPTSRTFTPSQRAAALDAALGDPEEQGEGTDWARVSIFGGGLAIGLAIGAGVALLLAPHTGAESRAILARRTRRLGARGHDAWDDLRDELAMAARRGGRRIRRSATRTAWAAEDALADRMHRRRRGMESLDD